MQGYLSFVLHAHLPFVRHPEHERFLEENWLFEAITETYLPLLRVMEGWERDEIDSRLTMTLSPPLCAMLGDDLLRERYARHLQKLIDLAEKEVHRTLWEKELNPLAEFYLRRFIELRDLYIVHDGDLVGAFRHFQDIGNLEIITSSATHAVLPLLRNHPPSIRAQILVARDHYRACFGREPRGIWLPECAYAQEIEPALLEANLRWFITDTHGLLHATPPPQYGIFAPVYTPRGLAVFGRDLDSARQVWSRDEGYPGDPDYRDFYRDIGFDLDLDYLLPYLPAAPERSFTGIKYHRITGLPEKKVYRPETALKRAGEHARHFLQARVAQAKKLAGIMERPAFVLCPYDAELFGHWWHEGPEFLDLFFRKAVRDQDAFRLTTPGEYLEQHPAQQVVQPSASSWGEEGFWKVWLNENTAWIYPHLQIAQERMTELARQFNEPSPLVERALKQAARELLLAQSSDWPFILRTGTSPDYARGRIKDHLLRFLSLHEQLTRIGINEEWLGQLERTDNLFPDIDYHYWRRE
jgi:1,4-alpha-glucan branching enzyme